MLRHVMNWRGIFLLIILAVCTGSAAPQADVMVCYLNLIRHPAIAVKKTLLQRLKTEHLDVDQIDMVIEHLFQKQKNPELVTLISTLLDQQACDIDHIWKLAKLSDAVAFHPRQGAHKLLLRFLEFDLDSGVKARISRLIQRIEHLSGGAEKTKEERKPKINHPKKIPGASRPQSHIGKRTNKHRDGL